MWAVALQRSHSEQLCDFSPTAPVSWVAVRMWCELSHFSRVQLFVTPWTVSTRLFYPWDFPGKNTAVGCRAFLQGIFLTQ